MRPEPELPGANSPGAMVNCVEELDPIPSLIGRLERVSSFLVPARGQYEAPGRAASVSWRAIDRTLREEHATAFARWLAPPVRGQLADLRAYFQNIGCDPKLCLSTQTYAALVPPSACQIERRLFFLSLEVALAALMADPAQPVKCVAGRLGYSNPGNFIREFHSAPGITPTECRERFAKVLSPAAQALSDPLRLLTRAARSRDRKGAFAR